MIPHAHSIYRAHTVADAPLAGQLDGLSECSFDHFFAVLQSALDWRDRAPLSGQFACTLVLKSAFNSCCLPVCLRVRACERTWQEIGEWEGLEMHVCVRA
jgi:hypothetical protein